MKTQKEINYYKHELLLVSLIDKHNNFKEDGLYKSAKKIAERIHKEIKEKNIAPQLVYKQML